MAFFFLPVDRAFFDVSRGTYYAIFTVILYTSFLYIIVILLMKYVIINNNVPRETLYIL